MPEPFTHCFDNISTTEEYHRMQEKMSGRITKTYKLYHGWLALAPTTLGFIFTVIYIAAVYRAIRQHRVSRKCYVLLLNRAFGDILACLVAFSIIGYVLGSTHVNRNAMQVMDVFFVGTFWTSMVSYVALSLIKLYAVAKPISYRNNVTMKRCIYLVILSWIIFLVFLAYSLGTVAVTKIEYLNKISGCRIETCTRLMYRIRNFVNVSVYFFTIICFLAMVVLVRRARKFVSSFHKKSEKKGKKLSLGNRFPMWKIALNVATFAAFNVFYVIWGAALLYNKDPCFYQRNYVMMSKILGFVRFSLLLRIVMDPILSFITDFQVRRSALAIFGIMSRITPFDSRRKVFDKSTSSDDHSSENTADVTLSPKTSAVNQEPSGTLPQDQPV
jgi:hypothetical protein